VKCVGLVTVPIGKASVIPVSHMIDIASAIFQELYFVTGGQGLSIRDNRKAINIYETDTQINGVKRFRVLKGIISILRTTAYVGYFSRKINLWIFPMGADTLLPAIITAKYRAYQSS